MTDFATLPAALPGLEPLDPSKHVNFTLGMVLGVDDFEQEFAYHSARDRRLARELGGYGTVWGLDVAVEEREEQAGGPRINVSPGLAVTPCGQLVCVAPAQCAAVNDWLDRNREAVRKGRPADAAAPLDLHVVLCYRECPTDEMPIPGEPCRSEDTLTAPSRIRDDFRLELRLQPPQQPEEDGIRDLVAWLRAIPVAKSGGASEEELLDALKAAAKDALERLAAKRKEDEALTGHEHDEAEHDALPVPFVLLAPPPDGLKLTAADMPLRLRAAFRFWVTQLRDALRSAVPGCDCGCERSGPCGCGCESAGGRPDEDCDEDALLLASLEVTLTEGDEPHVQTWRLAGEDRRPYLLHTRLLQEWMLYAGAATGGGGSAPAVPPPIDEVTAVTADDAAAHWDAAARRLKLEIPWGVKDVQLVEQAAGTPPKLEFDKDTRTVRLLIAPGERGQDGMSGTVIEKVVVEPIAHDAAPEASLDGTTLLLQVPRGEPGRAGTGGRTVTHEVAAGRFLTIDGEDPQRTWSFNELEARPTGQRGIYLLSFKGYRAGRNYVVTGAPLVSLGHPQHGFEIVAWEDERLQAIADEMGMTEKDGLVIRIGSGDDEPRALGFVAHVHQYPEDE